MSKQLLTTLAAAAVAASTVALATPVVAADWTHADVITTTADTAVNPGRNFEVVGYGDGFAAAVWFDTGPAGRRVMAARFKPNANNGEWDLPVAISTFGHSAYDPTIEVNGNGDLVAAWTENHDGVEELYAAVQPVDGVWSPARNLTPGATNVVPGIDVGIADDRTVYAAAEYTDADDATFGLRVVEWAYPALPEEPLLVVADGGEPALDVSGAGEVVLAFTDGGADQYAYTRHSPGGTWKAAVPLGSATQETAAATINDDGEAAVAYVSLGSANATVQLVAPAGGKKGTAKVLASGVSGTSPVIDIDGTGRLLAAWADVTGSAAIIHASSLFGGAWTTTSSPAVGGTVGNLDAGIAESGAQAVGYTASSRQVVLHRPRSGVDFTPWVSADGYAARGSVATDLRGNVVALGALLGPDSTLRARYLDTVGPTVTATGWSGSVLTTEVLRSPGISFETAGGDWLSGLSSVDVLARVAPWNAAGYGPRTTLADDRPAGATQVDLPAGASYCLAVRGTDGVGNNGEISKEVCFTTPLDDRAFTATGWTLVDGPAPYQGTLTTTKTKGRALVRTGVRARHLALLVTKVVDGGKVQVKLGDEVLGNYSLEGTGSKQLIDVATFDEVRTGTLRITVISEGKPVRIDGVVIAK
ncbi:hypothetical protein [Nocardioides stalactiti]|uniref:hypothetical protein n=1 Tax=Nocardioides stalactiti TaxID=2755356 RepID=UPI0016025505|nr:hypothetical protein [Nocardioides stalactiti]